MQDTETNKDMRKIKCRSEVREIQGKQNGEMRCKEEEVGKRRLNECKTQEQTRT